MKVAVVGLGYVGTLCATPPPDLIDLTGWLGREVESRPGYEGLSW